MELNVKNRWILELKRIGVLRIIILLIAVIIIIVCSLPEKNKTITIEKINEQQEKEEFFCYEKQLEKRLEDILGQLDGIDSVDVMISLSSTSEKVLEKNIQTEENIQEEDKKNGDDIEKKQNKSNTKTSEVVLMGNASAEVPYVLKEKSPVIQGVIVAAEGRMTKTKISEISEAVQALFGIDAHKIKVIEKKSQAS